MNHTVSAIPGEAVTASVMVSVGRHTLRRSSKSCCRMSSFPFVCARERVAPATCHYASCPKGYAAHVVISATMIVGGTGPAPEALPPPAGTCQRIRPVVGSSAVQLPSAVAT